MKVKEELIGKRKGTKRRGMGEKRIIGSEYVQSMLQACMKMSQ
jgi:hypothetical protein